MLPVLPTIEPQLLKTAPRPFGSGCVYELKYDDFRTMVRMDGSCQLISRNGNPFTGYDGIRECLHGLFRNRRVIMDAELVCLDENGFPQFEDLLFRRRAALRLSSTCFGS